MSPAFWPLLLAIATWLIVRLTGLENHTIDGIIFGAAVLATIGIVIWNNNRNSLNDKAGK